MKFIPPARGFHHISIVSLLDSALGCTGHENAQKLVDWLTLIAENSPDIISIETIINETNEENSRTVFFKVLYTGPDGLERVRSSCMHEEMIAWFKKVSLSQRMDVDRLIS